VRVDVDEARQNRKAAPVDLDRIGVVAANTLLHRRRGSR
jgi:hypothetical protein